MRVRGDGGRGENEEGSLLRWENMREENEGESEVSAFYKIMPKITILPFVTISSLTCSTDTEVCLEFNGMLQNLLVLFNVLCYKLCCFFKNGI